MERKFQQYKWAGLVSFGFMYNLVYLGRFNVNNRMGELAEDLDLTAGQQDVISISVFLTYAIGSFINGYLADRYGAKKIVVTGGLMSGILNLSAALQTQWIPLLIIWLANGYFQSMIWVGGISLLANWWQEGERGKGVGIANFFSGMSHATAYVVPVVFLTIWPYAGWRQNFVVSVLLLLLFTVLFGYVAVEKPEHRGLKPYPVKNRSNAGREKIMAEIADQKQLPWKTLFCRKRFWWWCAIAMISSICRYGLLNWIPLYFNEKNGSRILSETFSNLTLPVGMAFGTLIITWIAGTKLFNNKGIIITAMAALCGTLVVIFPMLEDMQAVLVGIFFTGFVLYGINGILWLYAIDQGCRVFAGSAAGIFNGFAYLGACLEGVVFPAAMNFFHYSMTVFIVMEALCICMVVCGMVVSRKNTVVIPEVRE